MASVAIIDYGVGNLRSVEKAFAATGCDAVVTSDESVLRRAERLVLPGVGAFRACIKALSARGFDELVREQVANGTPLLGVCVGMQMLFEESEEFGRTPGLNLLRGQVRRFRSDRLYRTLAGTRLASDGRIRSSKVLRTRRFSTSSIHFIASPLRRGS